MGEVTACGQVLWKFFVALHPVLKQALPKNAHRSSGFSLSVKDDITKLRHNVSAIPLSFPNADFDKSKLDDTKFSQALDALLEVLETLVDEKVLNIYDNRQSHSEDPEEKAEHEKLQSRFRRLLTLTSVLRGSITSSEMPTDTDSSHKVALVELATHVDFVRLGKQQEYSLKAVVQKIREFRTAVDKIFADPVEALQRNLGNAAQLTHEETSFIQKAYHLNSWSRTLFALLANGVACTESHEARLHLSGFLASDISFQLRFRDCGQQKWNFAKCTWTTAPNQIGTKCREHLACANLKRLTTSQQMHIAFNQDAIWDDENHDTEASHLSESVTDPTLHELLLPRCHNSNSDVAEFEQRDRRVVELLIAYSLLNLDNSRWVKLGLTVDTVSLRVTETLNSLERWKPHVSCSLASLDGKDDENVAVLSFGLLLMEMEAKRLAEPKEEDAEWGSDRPSRDSMLKRVLEEWTGYVEDGYKDIATACLLFRQLSEKFYDPSLTQEKRRAAAMYRYILAPLYRLVTSGFRAASELFGELPRSAPSPSIPAPRTGQLASSSGLELFDGKEMTTPDPLKVKNAKTFMEELDKFAETIELLAEENPSAPLWAPWRADKIRIAIIDTGIDNTDNIIKGALDDERIKECCGFVNGPDAAPDPNDVQDKFGHGTHVARLVLNAAPSAEVYIAKIADDKTVNRTDLHRIARAIRWATKKRVHIISMSLGLESSIRDIEMDAAIHAAVSLNISIFAAASNSGGNKPRAYPSIRRGVICIHASDGVGNDGLISPTPLKKRDNFSTLGICIPSKWQGVETHISGTSFATPIAAALIANVLEFARHKCELSEHEQTVLHHYDGVCQILRLMVEENAEARGGYDYIMPYHLWTAENSEANIIEWIRQCARG